MIANVCRDTGYSSISSSLEPQLLEHWKLGCGETPFNGGEVGFMYGHSSGKFGGDEFGTYIDGTVGNDKFQINAGASYQEWNGRFPRRIR